MATKPPKRGTIISRVLAAVHAGKAHSLHAIARRAGMSERDLYDDEKVALDVARLRASARNEEAATEPMAMEARPHAGLDFHLASGRVEWSNYYDSWKMARLPNHPVDRLIRAALAKDTEAASAIAAEITEKHGPPPPAPQEETGI